MGMDLTLITDSEEYDLPRDYRLFCLFDRDLFKEFIASGQIEALDFTIKTKKLGGKRTDSYGDPLTYTTSEEIKNIPKGYYAMLKKERGSGDVEAILEVLSVLKKLGKKEKIILNWH